MPIDFDAVRKAFHGPPLPSPPDHLPTREEVLAEHQRICLQVDLEYGVDPAVHAVGEHGSLIGGPGKPLTFLGRPVECLLRLEPMPLEWFDFPEARTVWFQPRRRGHDHSGAHRVSRGSHCHPSSPATPTGQRPASSLPGFGSPASSSPRIGALYNIFETILAPVTAHKCSAADISPCTRSPASSSSRKRGPPELISWLHQFAVDPRRNPRP